MPPRGKTSTTPKPEVAEVAEPEQLTEARDKPRPQTPQEIATQMAAAGVSEAIIIATLNAQFGGGDTAPPFPPGQAATPGGGELLGPDPAMVAAYKERMKTYKKPQTHWRFGALRDDDPELRQRLAEAVEECNDEMAPRDVVETFLSKLHGFGGVRLPKMFNEWCVQWQYWQMTIRKMPEGQTFTESKVLEDMVRFHWFNHPQERARLRMAERPNVASGPAKMFNPGAGGWT